MLLALCGLGGGSINTCHWRVGSDWQRRWETPDQTSKWQSMPPAKAKGFAKGQEAGVAWC